MVISFTLPEPGKKKRVKDMIIDILAFEWPLSLSQIYNRIKKNYSHSVTCQATYKAITELLDAGVLIKENKLYSINADWIDKLKEFCLHIQKNHSEEEKLPLIEGVLKAKTDNNVTVLTFNSTLEMDKMWMRIKKEYYKNLDKEKDVTFWEGAHCWWLLIYPESEHEELNRLKEKGVRHFFINHGDKNLDKHAKKFYEHANIEFKIDKGPVECDIGVFGDTIMQVYLPKEIKHKIERIYEDYKSASEINIPEFIDNVLKKKVQINLILTKNKEIADQLKKRVLNEFN